MCGKAPKAPPPPAPSAQELSLIEKQGKAVDAYLQSVEEQKLLSGFYTPVYRNGKLVGTTLDTAAFERAKNIGLLQADRYEKALKGELPVSQGLLQRKEDDFRLVRETSSRRGNEIVGNTLDEASIMAQNSTSGNELVGQLRRTYGLLEDAERRGELSAGFNLPSSGSSGYGQGVGMLGNAMQPYQFQRGLMAQTDMLNAQNRASQRAGAYGLGAGILGLGAGYLAGR